MHFDLSEELNINLFEDLGTFLSLTSEKIEELFNEMMQINQNEFKAIKLYTMLLSSIYFDNEEAKKNFSKIIHNLRMERNLNKI